MDDLDWLESVAQQFVARVREDDPEANLRWLRAQVGTDPDSPVSDAERLLFVVAVAVPTSRTWRDLTEWVRSPEDLAQMQAMRRQALINATARANGAGRRRVAAEDAVTTSHPPDGVAA